jgi:hypothetical protein
LIVSTDQYDDASPQQVTKDVCLHGQRPNPNTQLHQPFQQNSSTLCTLSETNASPNADNPTKQYGFFETSGL